MDSRDELHDCKASPSFTAFYQRRKLRGSSSSLRYCRLSLSLSLFFFPSTLKAYGMLFYTWCSIRIRNTLPFPPQPCPCIVN